MLSLLTIYITVSYDLGSQCSFLSYINASLCSGLYSEGMAVEEENGGRSWCLYGIHCGRAHVCSVVISSNTVREEAEQVNE